MISYNHKYRGQFEYEKFLLNILPFYNTIKNLETLEIQGTNEELESLLSIQDEVNKTMDMLTGKDSISDRFYVLSIKERECTKLWYQRWQVMN